MTDPFNTEELKPLVFNVNPEMFKDPTKMEENPGEPGILPQHLLEKIKAMGEGSISIGELEKVSSEMTHSIAEDITISSPDRSKIFHDTYSFENGDWYSNDFEYDLSEYMVVSNVGMLSLFKSPDDTFVAIVDLGFPDIRYAIQIETFPSLMQFMERYIPLFKLLDRV